MSGGNAKASLLMRGAARAVDLIIVAFLMKSVPPVGFWAGLLYILISDGLFDGRSVGKRIMNLKVISLPRGNPATCRDSVVRNIPLVIALLFLKIPFLGWPLFIAVIGFEFLLMLGNREGRRIGDELAGTMTVGEEWVPDPQAQ